MSLNELMGTTDEEVMVYKVDTWNGDRASLADIPMEKTGDYIVNKFWIEDNKIAARVTHLTYMIE